MIGDLNCVPLSSLSVESRNLLSCLLNPVKVLPINGPLKLTRDWRGLASLVNISSEVGASISQSDDKTGRVLTIWMQQEPTTGTVGCLMRHLETLDRYDICDDLMELAEKGRLIDNSLNRLAVMQPVPRLQVENPDLLTYDDKLLGAPTLYNALVLFAEEDRPFAEELRTRMTNRGLRVCTLDDMQAGTATQFAPASRLITERCYRIILLYSPDFLRSPANKFYMDYAQAVGIESNQRKILPLMYRECQVPAHLTFYHKLYYTPPGHKAAYDLWQRLHAELLLATPPAPVTSSHSGVRIAEMSSGTVSNGQQQCLALPPPHGQSVSCQTLDKLAKEDTKSVSSESQISEKRKKTGPLRKIWDTMRGKKHKKAILARE